MTPGAVATAVYRDDREVESFPKCAGYDVSSHYADNAPYIPCEEHYVGEEFPQAAIRSLVVCAVAFSRESFVTFTDHF